ncbi:MAG TPA: APC family permease [Streptosporangiaceae bacterium]|nr:APC family permease [Streptosporangiaceae bacterium]
MAEDSGAVAAPAVRAPVGERIGRANLRTVEASGLSLAGLAPTMAMALGTAFAASEAGGAVPLSYLLAMIGSFSLAFVVVRFARRYDVASGVAFTYVRASLGKLAGFVTGWLYVAAWLSSTAVVLAIGGVSFSALLARNSVNISWAWIFLAELAIVTALNYLGVRPSVRLLVLLELVSMATLAGVMIHVIAVGGASGLSWRPFDPSLSPKGWSGIGYGMIYGFSGFAGFEAAAALGRESRDPRRVIPRAIIFSLLAAAVFYILVTYALSIGYGITHAGTWAGDPAPLDTIVGRFSGSAWAQTIDAMVAISAFSSGLGLVTLSTRVLFDISRDGQAPRALSWLQPRFATPYVGVILAAVIALVLALAVGLATTPSTMIGFLAGANTLGLILVYVVMSLGALWAFLPSVYARAESAGAAVLGIGVPVVAVGLLGYAFYASVVPQPAFPYNLTPVAVAGVVLISLIAAAIMKRRGSEPDFGRRGT